jgi:flagellin
MASNITLSAGVRQNLLALQNTASLLSTTQNRLATGKKVNSALDNPINFFTSSSLSARASDLSQILDSMSNGISTLQAANNGLTSITNTVNSMQATVNQARQDSSWKSTSYTVDATAIGTATVKNLTFSAGAVGTTPVSVALNDTAAATSPVLTAGSAFTPLDMTTGDETYGFNVSVDGGAAVTISLATGDNTGGGTTLDENETIAGINADLAAASSDARVRDNGGKLEFYIASGSHTGASSSIAVGTFTNGGTTPSATTFFGFGASATASGAAAGGAGTAKSVDQLVTAINANTSLIGKVKASNNSGKLQIENISTGDLVVTGVTGTAVDGSASTSTIGGNTVRTNLAGQFNELRDQLDKLASDASFNGINLLAGDLLKLVFNESSTSTLNIQAKDQAGNSFTFNSANLGITFILPANLDTDTSIDGFLSSISQALATTRSQASNFGSSLSIVQNRQDFTKAMINTLKTGADNLTLADTNEEGANMLALQTRQQLSTTALSLAAQADQAVLRLFG